MTSLHGERQISVDPLSLKEPASYLVTSSLPLPPLLKPSPSGFLSSSLPNSASSSPTVSKKKWKNQASHVSSLSVDRFARQHSVALNNLERLREIHMMRRSKTCGEGRTSQPSVDFDLLPKKSNSPARHQNRAETDLRVVKKKEEKAVEEDKVKCGALCLFIPGFSKAKPVRARTKEETDTHMMGQGHVVSKRVSLEKFECGSWTSSGLINNEEEDEDENSPNLFFDLPMELIKSNANDTETPVTTAFVFDNNKDSTNHHHIKGVLKNSTNASASLNREQDSSSSRHVRFSTTSNPTSPTACITPRLQKAREDFNAFLEAQIA